LTIILGVLQRNSIVPNNTHTTSLRLAGTVAMLSLLTGCQPKPVEKIVGPPSTATTGLYWGSPLAPPGPAPAVAPTAQRSPTLKVTFTALQKMPEASLQPLGAQARFLSATRGRTPVLPTARLTQRTRVGTSTSADNLTQLYLPTSGQSIALGSFEAALPPGATAWFRLDDASASPDAVLAGDSRKSLQLRVHHRITPSAAAPELKPLSAPAPAPGSSPGSSSSSTTAPATAPSEPATKPASATQKSDISNQKSEITFAPPWTWWSQNNSTAATTSPATSPASSSNSLPATTIEIALLVDDLTELADAPANSAEAELPTPRTPLSVPGLSDDSYTATSTQRAARTRALPMTIQRELALLDGPRPDQQVTGVLIVPLRMTGGNAAALAITLEMVPGSDDDEHREQFARAIADAAPKEQAPSTQPASRLPSTGAQWTSVAVAMSSLDDLALRRPSLLFLARETGATFAADAALVADEQTLTWYIQRFGSLLLMHAPPKQPADVGWSLDLAAWQVSRELLSAGRLPPELTGVLTSHAGEAGRRPASLEESLSRVPSRSELQRRLILENQVFLEDTSPASRVRATDWLAARNAVPQGYDPLDTAAHRRDALNRTSTLPTTPATKSQKQKD
jgi:hypothetical protein